MKSVAVISDTHGNRAAIEKILPVLLRCDYVFHLGDGLSDMKPFERELGERLVTVKGNCDAVCAEKTRLLEIEGKRIMLTHGDLYGVKYDFGRISFAARENRADAVFFGHSHTATVIEEGGVIFANPGTMARTAVEKSYMFVSVTGDKIKCTINRAAFFGEA